jgi:hypothetical protein
MKGAAVSLWHNRRAKERALEAIVRLFAILGNLGGSKEAIAFNQSASEILLATTQNREPSQGAMSIFLEALNGKMHQVKCQAGQIASEAREQAILKDDWIGEGEIAVELDFLLWKRNKARIISGEWDFQMDFVRCGAEALRAYLQMIAVCGPLHKSCALEGCNQITVGGQGNKRFCCDEHRKEYWSYARRKEYFRQNRQLSREIKKRQRHSQEANVSKAGARSKKM